MSHSKSNTSLIDANSNISGLINPQSNKLMKSRFKFDLLPKATSLKMVEKFNEEYEIGHDSEDYETPA